MDFLNWFTNPLLDVFSTYAGFALFMGVVFTMRAARLLTEKRYVVAAYQAFNAVAACSVYVAFLFEPPIYLVRAFVLVLTFFGVIGGIFGVIGLFEQSHPFNDGQDLRKYCDTETDPRNPRSLWLAKRSSYLLDAAIMVTLFVSMEQFSVRSLGNWVFQNLALPTWTVLFVVATLAFLAYAYRSFVLIRRGSTTETIETKSKLDNQAKPYDPHYNHVLFAGGQNFSVADHPSAYPGATDQPTDSPFTDGRP